MVEVEIWSDFACPFCYIGKKHFEKALQKFGNSEKVKITYRSFELDPKAPKSYPKSIYEVLANKYGQTVEWARNANERVVKIAEACGLDFQMDRVIPSNSFDAHRLNQLARAKGVQDEFQESLFKAYFTEGLDIAKEPELLKLGERAGLNPEDIKNVLQSKDYAAEVREDEKQAREFGITGVPFFLFNRQYAVSGAQPPETFLELLNELNTERQARQF